MSNPPDSLQVRSHTNGHSKPTSAHNGEHKSNGNATNGSNVSEFHDLDNSVSPPAISESRDIPSHTNATQSVQGVPNDTLLLPKFKKNQRQIDHHSHHTCCDPSPPGRFIANAEPGVVCKNAIGLHGFASINVGTRDHMEDRHRIQYGKPDGLYRAFFGVFGQRRHTQQSATKMMRGLLLWLLTPRVLRCLFLLRSDGHGGEEASHYAHLNLAQLVTDELHGQYRAKSGTSNSHGVVSQQDEEKSQSSPSVSVTAEALQAMNLDYKTALSNAFDKLEEQVLRQSRHIGCRDGTTVTTVLITHDTIYCSNTGDSRTVLCRENNAVALSHDHKPSSESERARIVAAGGEVRAVMLDRAEFCCFKAKKVPHGAERLWPGGFSVSRAVGDIDYKDIRRKKASVVNGTGRCAAAFALLSLSSRGHCAHRSFVCFFV